MNLSKVISSLGTAFYLGVATGLFNGMQDLVREVPRVLKLFLLEGIFGMFFGLTMGQFCGSGMYFPYVVFHIVRAISYHVSVNICKRICSGNLPIGTALWNTRDVVQWFQDVVNEIKTRANALTNTTKRIYRLENVDKIQKLELALKFLVGNAKFQSIPEGRLLQDLSNPMLQTDIARRRITHRFDESST